LRLLKGKMITFKSAKDIKIMKEGGKVAAGVLCKVLENVKPGITTLELDTIAEDFIVKCGMKPSFKTVENYSFATCININEGLVHGLPSKYRLKKGDLVSIDLGVYYKGLHTDLSYTVEVETQNEGDFLNAGKKALDEGIKKCVVGSRVGDISSAMQIVVEKAGYSVSRDLVGHGIGRKLHEDPYIPCYGRSGRGAELKEGMTLAVEIIYQKGDYSIKVLGDNWTIVTEDGSLAGLFEHTVVVTKNGPVVLTK